MSPRRDFGQEAVVAAIKQNATKGQRRVSVATLMDETGLSERAVQRAVQRAVAAHQIARIDDAAGGAHTGLYRLVNGSLKGPVPTLLKAGTPVVTTPPSDPRRHDAPHPRRDDAPPPSSRPPVVTTPDVKPLRGNTGRTSGSNLLGLSERLPAENGAPPVASAAERSVRARARGARPRTRRPLFDAIALAWLGEGVEPGKTAASVVAMAEREIAGYGGEAEQVAERWAECCRRYDEPTPLALAKHWIALGRPMRTAQRSQRAAAMASAVDRAEQLRREGR